MKTQVISTPNKQVRQLLVLVSMTLLCALGTTSARATSLVVPSNPLWTDTGIRLGVGQRVSITASGSWNWGTSHFNGPDGDPGIYGGDFYSGVPQGALIGYTGVDPFQGHRGDSSFWPQSSGYLAVGSSANFTSLVDGELWLGFNDDAFPEASFDNSGSVTAQIEVVPEPASLALLLFAGTTILFCRRSEIRPVAQS